MSNSKYQEAFDRILEDDYNFPHDFYEEDKAVAMEHDIDTLQQLIDKMTPKKPHLSEIFKDEDTETIYDEDGYINETICVCPNCGKHTIFDYEYSKRFKYCSNCAQAIDWSDEE